MPEFHHDHGVIAPQFEAVEQMHRVSDDFSLERAMSVELRDRTPFGQRASIKKVPLVIGARRPIPPAPVNPVQTLMGRLFRMKPTPTPVARPAVEAAVRERLAAEPKSPASVGIAVALERKARSGVKLMPVIPEGSSHVGDGDLPEEYVLKRKG